MARHRAVVPHLVLAWALLSAAAPQRAELTGVVTQLDGAVELVGPGAGEMPLVSTWQVVRAGAALRVPDHGAAGVVCSNHRFVRLHGPVSWTVSEQSCAAGRELTPGEYALVIPQAGRFKIIEGLLTLEREPRTAEGDDVRAPLVLSPRNTALLSPRPTVYFRRASPASEYRVEWSGRGTAYDTRLAARDLPCGAQPAGGTERCSMAWPPDRADLPPGQTFFLTVSVRGAASEPWRASGPFEVRTLSLAEARAFQLRLHDLDGLGFEGPALNVARGGLLATCELYSEAAEAYQRALAGVPALPLLLTLADIDLAIGLDPLAESVYRELLTAGEPATRAAAAFGLGRIDYFRGHFSQAALDFRRAQDLYGAAGASQEEAAARKAAEQATARASR